MSALDQRWRIEYARESSKRIRTLYLLAALKSCRNSRDLERLVLLHEVALKCGDHDNLFVASSLVDLYAKCGSTLDASRVFDLMPRRDVITWNALMFGYAENGAADLALQLFARMRGEGCAPDSRSFVAALKACATLAVVETEVQVADGECVKMQCLERGMEIHSQAVASGCESEVFVACTLIDMYAKCGSMISARDVFDRMAHHTVVAWNVLILGYAENGEHQAALDAFQQMQCAPDTRTFVAALQACCGLSASERGRYIDGQLLKPEALRCVQSIHRQAASCGLESSIFVSNSLVDMYAKCGSMDDAHRLFDKMRRRDAVSWNSLIFGYVENGEGGKALQCFKRMECAPTTLTFLAALKACGSVVSLEVGNDVRDMIRCRRLENDIAVACSLVDFYGKCGCMADAQAVFDTHATKNSATWTSLIAGYSRQGDAKRVFDLLEAMQSEGLQPDAVTFLCVLAACNHAGLVEKAKECFELMASKYRVYPTIDHYHCMVDILGKANALDAAVAMIRNMAFKQDAVTWKTLLSSCLKWNNEKLGKLAFESLVRLTDVDGFGYVLMANMYEVPVEVAQSSWTDFVGSVHAFRG